MTRRRSRCHGPGEALPVGDRRDLCPARPRPGARPRGADRRRRSLRQRQEQPAPPGGCARPAQRGELDVLGTDVARRLDPAELRRLRRRRIGFVRAALGAARSSRTCAAADQLRQVAALRGGAARRRPRPWPRSTSGAARATGRRRSSGGEQQRLAVAAGPGRRTRPGGRRRADRRARPRQRRPGDVDALLAAAAAGRPSSISSHDDRVVSPRRPACSGSATACSRPSRRAPARTTAVIDSTGRVQLPPEALDLFPTGGLPCTWSTARSCSDRRGRPRERRSRHVGADGRRRHPLLRRRTEPAEALDQVSMTVGSGELVCLAGPSGSGKSSLCHIAAGPRAARRRNRRGRRHTAGRGSTGPWSRSCRSSTAWSPG